LSDYVIGDYVIGYNRLPLNYIVTNHSITKVRNNFFVTWVKPVDFFGNQVAFFVLKREEEAGF
jgi:hypothetical protein